ncbi:hypothetical protein RvY_11578 [Ramazzottius varieornatus]|uniref:G-protein coupled receptors family 1 profile domain-containing protein n=1 Tax=Ramazzottius varieornatus TaxID=947166 RepID=A0A1D1VGJ9_RAMVA|nr:hypothetical protein RvY_11578 [Ramazzottius varieornatus]
MDIKVPGFTKSLYGRILSFFSVSRQSVILPNGTLASEMLYSQNISGNETLVNDGPHWGYASVLSLVIMIAGFITNSSALLVFIKNSNTLITPFNVYLINLLLANLSNLIVFYPLDIFHQVNGNNWRLGTHVCTLYLYGFFVLNAFMGNSHLLIIFNRLWAVTFPISYRNTHSRSLAIKICVGMWIYLHACLLPGVILDALYYRPPLETDGCQFNVAAQFDWGESTQLLNFHVPLMLIALNYIFIVYKTMRRRPPKLLKNAKVQPAARLSAEDEG